MEIELPLFNQLKEVLLAYLPRVLGILLFIVVAWLLFKLIVFLSKRILKSTKIDDLSDKISKNAFWSKTRMSFDIRKAVLAIIKFCLWLLIVIVGASIFELDIVASGFGQILAYLPILFSALLILIFGILLATYLKKIVHNIMRSFGLSGARLFGIGVSYLILLVTIVMTLGQLGVDTNIITSNISIILGVLLTTIAIALGFGSVSIVKRLLYAFYMRKRIDEGDIILFDEKEYKVIGIEGIFLVLKENEEEIVLPIKDVADKKITIKHRAIRN